MIEGCGEGVGSKFICLFLLFKINYKFFVRTKKLIVRLSLRMEDCRNYLENCTIDQIKKKGTKLLNTK